MKTVALIIVSICGGLLFYTTADFPSWGDPSSPASSFVSPHYIEKAIEETAVPNIVTAVLADYRGYDTMLETTVIFTAGIVCFFLLRTFSPREEKAQLFRHVSTGIVISVRPGGKHPDDMTRFERIGATWTPYDLIIKNTSRLVIPFIMLFGLYVIAHGHYSPGGGFQGGVILGAAIILFAISYDLRFVLGRFSEKTSILLSATGVIIYAGTGVLCMAFGAVFLDYSALATMLFSDPIMARSHGILMVEIGVGMAVMAVMVWIYYNISSAGTYDEGL